MVFIPQLETTQVARATSSEKTARKHLNKANELKIKISGIEDIIRIKETILGELHEEECRLIANIEKFSAHLSFSKSKLTVYETDAVSIFFE